MKKIYLILLMVTLSFSAFAQERRGTPDKVKVRFYPNPATTIINFEFVRPTPESTYTLQVYSFIGRKIAEVPVNTNKASVQLDNYFRGVYIFQLRDKTGRIVESGKFQVIK